MNLSALNNGLTQAPMSNATEANTSLAAQQRPPAGTLSGEDFAAFLRNQINALKHTERQNLAAPKQPAPAPRAEPLTPYRPVREATDSSERAPNKTPRVKTTERSDNTQAAQPRSEAPAVQDEQVPNKAASEASPTAQQLQDAGPATAAQRQSEDSASPTEQVLASEAANTAPAASDAHVPAQLTTIPLGPSINIITTAQSQPDDQSVADFALAMGLDPSQVQALFGQTASSTPANQNVSTQQMLAMNSLPSFTAPLSASDVSAASLNLPVDNLNLATAVSTADFQELQASSTPSLDGAENATLNALSNLNIQIATAQATQTAAPAMSASTLAVLSMMDTELRAQDIEALKTEFDALAPTEPAGLGLGEQGPSASGTHANLTPKAASLLANNPNMAQTFDKLSEKLATELASRMNDQLNAGEWKMKFALKPASLGLVDVQLEMRDGRLTAHFNADTNLTQDLIQNGSQKLKEALGQLGMNNASVLVGQGQSQQQGQSGQSGLPARRDDNRVKLADDTATELTKTARPRHSNSLQFDNYA